MSQSNTLKTLIAFVAGTMIAAPSSAGCYGRTCTDVTISKVLAGTMGSSGEVDIGVSGNLGSLTCAYGGNLFIIDMSKPGAAAVVAQALTLYSLGRKVTVTLEAAPEANCVVRWIATE